jgi:hypothetical protein
MAKGLEVVQVVGTSTVRFHQAVAEVGSRLVVIRVPVMPVETAYVREETRMVMKS